MKIAGKKIPRGNVLLFFSFTAISLCLLLIVSAVRAEKVNRLNKYTMYSGHQRGFSVSGGDGVEQWEPVISELASQNEHFTLYVPIEDPGMIVKGICTRGDDREVPIRPGRFLAVSTKRILWNGMGKSISDLMRLTLKYLELWVPKIRAGSIKCFWLILSQQFVSPEWRQIMYWMVKKVIYWILASRYMITCPSPRM